MNVLYPWCLFLSLSWFCQTIFTCLCGSEQRGQISPSSKQTKNRKLHALDCFTTYIGRPSPKTLNIELEQSSTKQFLGTLIHNCPIFFLFMYQQDLFQFLYSYIFCVKDPKVVRAFYSLSSMAIKPFPIYIFGHLCSKIVVHMFYGLSTYFQFFV